MRTEAIHYTARRGGGRAPYVRCLALSLVSRGRRPSGSAAPHDGAPAFPPQSTRSLPPAAQRVTIAPHAWPPHSHPKSLARWFASRSRPRRRGSPRLSSPGRPPSSPKATHLHAPDRAPAPSLAPPPPPLVAHRSFVTAFIAAIGPREHQPGRARPRPSPCARPNTGRRSSGHRGRGSSATAGGRWARCHVASAVRSPTR